MTGANDTSSTQRCAHFEGPPHAQSCPTVNFSKSNSLPNKFTNVSPSYFYANCGCEEVKVELRSGCEVNLISESMAEVLALEIVISERMIDEYIVNETNQDMRKIRMNVIGLTWFSLYYGDLELTFEGLVIEDECVNTEIVGGAPFMEDNDISVRPSRRLITFSNDSVFSYGCQGNMIDDVGSTTYIDLSNLKVSSEVSETIPAGPNPALRSLNEHNSESLLDPNLIPLAKPRSEPIIDPSSEPLIGSGRKPLAEPSPRSLSLAEPRSGSLGLTEPCSGSLGLTEPCSGSPNLTEPTTRSLGLTEPCSVSLSLTEPSSGTLNVTEPSSGTLNGTEPSSGPPNVTEPSSGSLIDLSRRSLTLPSFASSYLIGSKTIGYNCALHDNSGIVSPTPYDMSSYSMPYDFHAERRLLECAIHLQLTTQQLLMQMILMPSDYRCTVKCESTRVRPSSTSISCNVPVSHVIPLAESSVMPARDICSEGIPCLIKDAPPSSPDHITTATPELTTCLTGTPTTATSAGTAPSSLLFMATSSTHATRRVVIDSNEGSQPEGICRVPDFVDSPSVPVGSCRPCSTPVHHAIGSDPASMSLDASVDSTSVHQAIRIDPAPMSPGAIADSTQMLCDISVDSAPKPPDAVPDSTPLHLDINTGPAPKSPDVAADPTALHRDTGTQYTFILHEGASTCPISVSPACTVRTCHAPISLSGLTIPSTVGPCPRLASENSHPWIDSMPFSHAYISPIDGRSISPPTPLTDTPPPTTTTAGSSV